MPKEDRVDYKPLYLKTFNAIEDTINHLIEIQRECEELYLQATEEAPETDEEEE